MNDVERQAWFRAYVERCEAGVIAPPSAGIRFACPCCRYPTLSERGDYDICHLCNWEDDGQDDPHAEDVWGGPNGTYSLAEARRNFTQHLIMYDPMRPTTKIGGADSPLEIEAKRSMITAFNAMPKATPEQLGNLWESIRSADAVLVSETKRKNTEYERQLQTRRPSP